MLASGLAELVSLGAVIPFLAVISDPQLLWQQSFIRSFATNVGFSSSSQLLIPATIAFAGAAMLSALIRLTNLWLNSRLAAAMGSDLSYEAFRRTLLQPYSVHLRRNSSEVIAGTTTQINRTVDALRSLLVVITSTIVSIGLLVGLLLIDAPVALATASVLGIAYILLSVTTRQELLSAGHKMVEASNRQVMSLQEALGAIRDVLLGTSQAIYYED